MNEELLNQIRKDMKQSLPSRRYKHTLGVAYTAASMAMCYGVDIQKAFAAGLLHDSAKYYSDEKMIAECEKRNLPISEVERRNAYLLHGKAGAIIANEQYNIVEEDILNAIRYHTTGRKGMSVLEKILFVADYIEPGRKMIDGLTEVRTLAFHDLDGCVVKILQDTIDYLSSAKDKEIDATTLETYTFYTTCGKEQ